MWTTSPSIDLSKWTENNPVYPSANGITNDGIYGGSLISSLAVPGGSNSYEVQTTLLAPVTGHPYQGYIHYLRATSNALNGPESAVGGYYAAELQAVTWNGSSCSATLAVYKRVSGVVSLLTSQLVGCASPMTLRSQIKANRLTVYVQGVLQADLTDNSLASGQPGVGVRATNYGITHAELKALDEVPPNAVDPVTISSSLQPNQVDLQWTGVTDNPGGSGLQYYKVLRNGVSLQGGWWGVFTDPAVSPSTSYSYTIIAVDNAFNESAPTAVTVTTPPAGAVDPRRVGVRPTGAYWGALGEQIDLLSGNLNFSVPLLQARSRGFAVPFRLNYNSQLWKMDSGAHWQLGTDVGFGHGWKLLAGSLRSYHKNWVEIHHWTFTDATGAEYRLDVNTNNIWTSREALYLSYDGNQQRLYFPDGSFWAFDCVSLGNEQDTGTRYPTLIQDSNGNQIKLRYQLGQGAPWGPSSARITEIEDVRAVWSASTSTYRTYTFSYSADAFPHLTAINNWILTPETYAFNYTVNQSLVSPFSPNPTLGSAKRLYQVVDIQNQPDTFQYLTSGELEKVTLRTGGYLRWTYGNTTYSAGRTQREIQTRVYAHAGPTTEQTYTFSHEGSTSSQTIHSWTQLDEPGGSARKKWTFASGPAAWQVGLLSRLEEGTPSVVLRDQQYTWVQDAVSNPYIGTVLTIQNPGANQVQQKTEQTLDTRGNLTQSKVYAFDSFVNPLRTFTHTYLTGSNYTSRYIFNRLASSTVSDGTATLTLGNNTYDTGTLGSLSNLREHDSANYPASFVIRGNRTSTTSFAQTTNFVFDMTGTVATASDNYGHAKSYTPDSSHNYAAPQTITPNSQSNLAQSFTYNASLAPTSHTGPNSAVSQASYDGYGRMSNSQDAHGVLTTYSYSYNPHVTTATTGGRFTRTTLDGLGRSTKVETGDGTGTKSVVDTEYAPCGCSPLGRAKRVSQPYAPGQTPVWTTYTYDALGRTTRVDLPDGSFSTTSYTGNATTMTDPAGKWKKYIPDSLGNLIQVNEPNPAGGADLVSSYGYGLLNQLAGVSQTRSGTTQTRTFSYDSQQRLQSVTHPESGSITYTYNADGSVAYKTDAKNQRTEYSYDAFRRVIQIRRLPSPGVEEVCQRVNLYYDQNPFNGSDYSGNRWGRLAAAQWFVKTGDACSNGSGTVGYRMSELYDYTVSGKPTVKQLFVKSDTSWPAFTTSLGSVRQLNYAYDSYGRRSQVTYPDEGGGVRRQLNYQFDSLWRPTTLTDGSANPLVKEVLYNVAGQMTEMKTRAWVYAGGNTNYYQVTRSYNVRQQLTRYQATMVGTPYAGSDIDWEYRFAAAQNNGQLWQEKNWISGEEVTYQYDSLTRLIAATTTGPEWGLSWSYDGFGNRTNQTVTKGSAPASALTYSLSNNRLTTADYDLNGNMTLYAGTSYVYDVENRLTKSSGSFGTERYGYDGSNRRVWRKKADGTEEFTLYGTSGERIEVFRLTGTVVTTATTNVYFAGQLSRTRDHASGVEKALLVDRLGSVRAQAALSIGVQQSSYYPYGEERVVARQMTATSSPPTPAIPPPASTTP